MKPFHLILLVLAAVGIATVISMYGNTTQYVAFPDAQRIAEENPGKAVHVVCKLNKAKPVVYDAQANANRLEFYGFDSLNNESKVVFTKSKPAQFEQLEKMVLIGTYNKDHFLATEILSKCPSKYEDAPGASTAAK
jgi:cytochrome c-type biogenesis protein CcmE